MREALLVLSAFLVMEPVTYLAHRYIFHGFGYPIHHSHHAPRTGVFERNDFYPLISAVITMSVIGLGILVRPLSFLIPIGFGMTVYGVIYFFVHDLVIHRRARWLRIQKTLSPWHYKAHRLHHRFGKEPYGLLIPVLPRRRPRKAPQVSSASTP